VDGRAGRERLRAEVLIAVTSAGALTLVLLLCAPPLVDLHARLTEGERWSALPYGLLLTGLAAVALAVVGLWLTAVVVASSVEVLTGASSALLRAVTPGVVRRAVLVCCGLTVGGVTALSPAAADPPAGTQEHAGAAVPSTASALAGLPLPDRAVGGAVRQAVHAADEGAPPHRLVHRGDSLWSIAEELLPPGSGAADIDTAWRRIYRVNRAAIGREPDLLTPGTTLRLPGSMRPHRANLPAKAPAHLPDPTTPRKDAS
jgi:hypothetical protein